MSGPTRTPAKSGAWTRLGRVSLLPSGLKQRLMVAFCLMSIFPLLVLGYVVTIFVLPYVHTFLDLWIVLALSAFLALLGMVIVRGLIFPIIRLATQAQAFAQGRLDKPVDVQAPGEVGELSAALNLITRRARENMEQLRAYGEQTHKLNLEINQRMLALSNVLQVSNLITQSTQVEEVLESILEKLSQLDEAEINCILEPSEDPAVLEIKAVSSVSRSQVGLLVHQRISDPWLRRVMEDRQMRVIDGAAASLPEAGFLQKLLGTTNAVLHPLVCLGRPAGLLVCANRKHSFVYEEDVLELLSVFAKQASIAMENDVLTRRAKKLEIMDELTGLYNAAYIRNRMEEEVRRAIRYSRPCSLVLLSIDDFQQIYESCGGLVMEKTLKAIAAVVTGRVTDVDRAGRISEDGFALILPERNKREAIELAEELRALIGVTRFAALPQMGGRPLTVSAGVSENPIDGSTGHDLMEKAIGALEQAKEQGKNRVIAA